MYASVNRLSIGSDNGLSPIRRKAMIKTNTGSLSIGPLGTNFNETFIKIKNALVMKMHLKVSSVKRRLFCLGGDELTQYWVEWCCKETLEISYTNHSRLLPHILSSFSFNISMLGAWINCLTFLRAWEYSRTPHWWTCIQEYYWSHGSHPCQIRGIC